MSLVERECWQLLGEYCACTLDARQCALEFSGVRFLGGALERGIDFRQRGDRELLIIRLKQRTNAARSLSGFYAAPDAAGSVVAARIAKIHFAIGMIGLLQLATWRAPSGLIFKSIGRKLSAVQRSTVGIPSVTQGGEKFAKG